MKGHPYPVDGKFFSEKDKAEIMSMPEARREQILSERMEELEKETFARQLRQRHEAQQKGVAASSDGKKRKLSTSDVDQAPRQVNHKKVKANENLEAYKRTREQRAGQRQRNAERRSNHKKSPQNRAGSSGTPSGDQDEVQWDATVQPAQPRQDQEVTLQKVENFRMTRERFARVCLTPGFEEVTTGLFVRVCIGIDHRTETPAYRLCQIKGNCALTRSVENKADTSKATPPAGNMTSSSPTQCFGPAISTPS